MSFIPAGHRFYGWQKPRALTRSTFLYIDPLSPLLGLDKSPVGALMLGDCGRSDREMRNGSGREIRATHESISSV